MTPEDAFVEDIRERPDDDTPRLIFADWLEDSGDPDRAEFIRAQVRLARRRDDPSERGALLLRCEALLKANWDRWARPLGPLLGEAGGFNWAAGGFNWAAGGYRHDAVSRFTRGFVEEVEVDAASLIGAAAELFRRHPIRHLRLHRAGEQARRLADCPQLAFVETLVFADYYRAPLDGRGMAWLAASPHLGRLWLLGLYNNYLGDEGAAALARARWLPRLKWVILDDNGLSADGVAALARTDLPFRPTRLHLSSNAIRDAGGHALASSPILSGVQILALRDCGLTEEGAAALANSPHLGALAELHLQGNRLGEAGLARVAAAPWRGRLRHLGV